MQFLFCTFSSSSLWFFSQFFSFCPIFLLLFIPLILQKVNFCRASLRRVRNLECESEQQKRRKGTHALETSSLEKTQSPSTIKNYQYKDFGCRTEVLPISSLFAPLCSPIFSLQIMFFFHQRKYPFMWQVIFSHLILM